MYIDYTNHRRKDKIVGHTFTDVSIAIYSEGNILPRGTFIRPLLCALFPPPQYQADNKHHAEDGCHHDDGSQLKGAEGAIAGVCGGHG